MAKTVQSKTNLPELLIMIVVSLTSAALLTFRMGDRTDHTALFLQAADTTLAVRTTAAKPERQNDSNRGQAFAAAPSKGEKGIESWKNISQLVSGYGFVAGLKSDGTVVAEVSEGFYYDFEGFNVSSWKDIN